MWTNVEVERGAPSPSRVVQRERIFAVRAPARGVLRRERAAPHRSRGGKRADCERLSEIGKGGAEIHMQWMAIDHQGRDRFHAGGRGFRHAIFGGAEMDDFEIDLGRIEIARDRTFSFEADRAARVIELAEVFMEDLFQF